MRPIAPLCLIVASVWLVGCSEPPAPVGEPPARPVKSVLLDAGGAGGLRHFPARIEASQRAELAFRVPGSVAELAVREGDRLQAGDPVARLDPRDYQLVVNDRQAVFDKARKNYDRGRELVETGALSQVDFDRLEADFKQARTALEAARQDLAYTTLTAPFAGVVGRRQVEAFEEVQARQPIITLQNIEQLEVRFDVPESILRGLRGGQGAGPGSDGQAAREQVRVRVSFDDRPGESFPLRFKEIATKADAQTQTFEATYLLDAEVGGVILPGMTATVTAELGEMLPASPVFLLPLAAVVGATDLTPGVWVVDEATMTTQSRPVRVGRVQDRRIEVLDGLQSGDRVVTAGAAYLAEGMAVVLMPEREQAVPRDDEPVVPGGSAAAPDATE